MNAYTVDQRYNAHRYFALLGYFAGGSVALFFRGITPEKRSRIREST